MGSQNMSSQTMHSSPAGDKDIALYGDESHFNEIVTYAFLVIPRENSRPVELAVNKVKNKYGLDDDAKIHCRELFNKRARSKTLFCEFTDSKVLNFLDDIMISAFMAGARGWVGYMDSRKAPDTMYFESVEASKPLTLELGNLKAKMQLCYQAAIGPLTHVFPPACVESFVDGDKTKIPFLNKNSQADSLRSFFPVEHSNQKFFPKPVHGSKPVFLDLADLLAYAAARGLAEASISNKNSFISIVKSMDPGYSEVVFDDASPHGEMIKIRSFDPGDRVKTYIKKFIQV